MLALDKKIMAIVGLAVLICSIASMSLAVVSPTRDFYVNDYAGLIDEEVEQYIIETNEKLESATGAQIVVVTVPSLGGQSLEEYATELFRKFGIGDKTKNNGVLLLLALKERQFRIEVGYGLEGVLTDGKTGNIQDEYIIPYLKNNNWNEGIKNGYSKILEEVSKEYNVDVGEISTVRHANINQNAGTIFGMTLVGMGIISSCVSKKIKKIILITDALSFIAMLIVNLFIPIQNFFMIAMFQVMIGIFFLASLQAPRGIGGGHFRRRGLFIRRWIFWRRRFIRRWRFF